MNKRIGIDLFNLNKIELLSYKSSVLIMIVYRLKIPSSYQPPYVAMPCTLQDEFIIPCPKFGTDKISGLNDP